MSDSHDTIPTDLKPPDASKLMRMLIIVVLGFVVLFLCGYLPRRANRKMIIAQAEQMAHAPPIVEVVYPKASALTDTLTLPGDVRAMQETSLFARTSGYLKKWNADIGDHVDAGQLLAEIDAPDVDAQLAEARASLEVAKANVVSAQNTYELALATLNRYKGLVATGGVTQQDLDTRQTAYSQAESGKQAAVAAVKSAEATVQRLEAAQGFEKIIAPFDGVVTYRGYDVGALISASDNSGGKELFKVAQTDQLRAFVNVPQTYVSLIKQDEQVELRVSNYPGRNFEGTVARWAGAIDPATRTMRTELHFDNRKGQLWAGMYGEVAFTVHREKPILTVPTTAVLFEADGMQVAVLNDNKVHFQPVTVGHDLGTEIEVATGLDEDQLVVTNPGEKLVEGIEVQPASLPPAPAPDPTADHSPGSPATSPSPRLASGGGDGK